MKTELNWGGRLLIGLNFAAGVALLIYLGIVVGMIVGLDRGATAMENTPHRNIGLAPDLTGLLNGTFEFAKSTLVGALVGLVAGISVMWAASRYLLAPLLRRTDLFTRTA